VLSSAYLGVLNEKQRVWQTSISEPKLKAPDTTIPTSTDESRAATVTGAGTVVVSAENMYARAREIIPQITRELFSGAPTFDTAPVPDLDMPATTGFNNAIKRMMGSSGHQIMVRHYKMGETEKDALDNVNKEITDTVDLFDSAVKQSTVKNDGKITSTARWIVRVLSTEMRSEVVGRIENRLRELNTFDGKLNEEAFNIAKDRVKVIVVNIEGAKHLNTVIDLLVDISMMEMHRYMIGDNVGPATSDFKSNVTNLLNMSATKLPAGSIEEIILAIFDGAEFVLRAFDWGELDKEWKRVQKVLIAA